MAHLPDFFRNSPEVSALEYALSTEVSKAAEAVEDVFRQLDLSTATWGLALWEHAYGIKSGSDISLEKRREIIMARIRGCGTITVDMIKNVTESYMNGEVDVIEIPEEYRIKIAFVSHIGIPSSMKEIKETIQEVLPAHLEVNYIIRYNTYRDLSKFTYQMLSQFSYRQLRETALLKEGEKTWNS